MDSSMKVFELKEVKLATNNFNDANFIGKGGFGYIYEGQQRGGTKAAFKRFDHGQGEEFWNEVRILSRYTHENLISLLGYCIEDGEMILVYELPSNGSLELFLSSTTLTWAQRIRICLDAAKGLCYLHEDKGNVRVFHGDIRSFNIQLDENWKAKVSDIGLAKVVPSNIHTISVTIIRGAPGYMDQLYVDEGNLMKESDVYSFGVVLLEVLCGRRCLDYSKAPSYIVPIWKKSYQENKLNKIMLKDDLVQALDQSSLEVLSEIAFQCLQESPENRPQMSDVVKKLETALKSQELSEKQCKLEAQIEPLIQKLSGITGYNGTGRYRRRRILARRTSKVKREISKAWKELMLLKQESESDQHNRWCVNTEVQNLFNVALRLSYPELRDEESKVVFNIKEYGEFHCEDVLLVWPSIRKKGKRDQGPRSVGYEIKKNLRLQQSEMIEGEPWVHDIGFVSINLSGKWMAKSLHKLLRDGVDTWAPPLFVKNFLVNIYFPSCDVADLTHMDSLRRELIKETLINILEYCRVGWRFMEPEEELPQEESAKLETFINAMRDGCSGDPKEDLKHLWHALKNEKANWIVCLTRVQQQKYIEMCFDAARYAEWLPPRREDSPRSSYTGYQSCSTSTEDLVSWFEEAKASKGYSEEDLMCAVKYALLKNHRLSDCTFSFEEVFNEKGNTYLYLLNTQSRNRAFLKKHVKDIDELKKACELTLGEDEIWEEGVERVLVLQLLEFNRVIALSCYPVLPHQVCEYLYDLSVRFNSYYDSWEVGIAGETKLLLCEATEVLMGKCFQLLGITRESSSSFGEKWLQESFGLTKSLLQSGRNPMPRFETKKKQTIELTQKESSSSFGEKWLQESLGKMPRFELFSVYIHVRSDSKLTNFKLFGQITISDKYGVFFDEWGRPNGPDFGTVSLFDCDWDDQIDVTNDGRLYIGNPSLSNLIPLSSSMEFFIELYATTVNNDELFVLPVLDDCKAKFAYFSKMVAATKCDVAHLKGKDGDARLYYVLLKDAMDCAIEVTYNFEEGGDREVNAKIYASYGDDFFQKNEDPLVKEYYTALLYQGCFGSKIAGNAGKVPLKRPMMAVPAKGSIVITAQLFDVDAQAGILDGHCKFTAQPKGMLEEKIDGTCCSLGVSVVWNQG